MVDYTRAIFSQSVRTSAAYFAISLLRLSGKERNVFGSKSAIDSSTPLWKRLLLLHLTFKSMPNWPKGEVFTMSALSGWEQKEVSTIDKRTDHRKALDRRRFVRDCPNPRPDQRRLVVCSPRSWSKLRELVEVWSSP